MSEAPDGAAHVPTVRRVLIAGLGNLLLSDDGVGVHVVRALTADPPAGAAVAEIGTAVLDALELLEAADTVIAVDAVQAGCEPGSVYRFELQGDDGAAKPQDGPAPLWRAAHELDLRSALPLLKHRPRVIVIGVEPFCLDYGLELSPAVAEMLPQVVAAVRELATALLTHSE